MTMNLNTKKRLYEYTKRIAYKELDFNPIKDTDVFLDNYKKHDMAIRDAVSKYVAEGWIVYPLGVDKREERVIVKNDIPDLYIERSFLSNTLLFCLEIKTKSSKKFIGWINKRAHKGYTELIDNCNIPIYIANCYSPKTDKKLNKWYWHQINNEYTETTAWDKNTVCIFSKIFEGLPFIDESIEIHFEDKKGVNIMINGAVLFNVTLGNRNASVFFVFSRLLTTRRCTYTYIRIRKKNGGDIS